ncbi:uncharacterized protein NDAI_0G04580 [Naumovozyma dairenensis CBS 421]|uniref:Uncharacterized protein n=1 Tax=Naumovozyma dairenensis (strain ATCC 10597 / BCRC 20456 / CBS 421 / NBRC 0211 / NRRL Y-12639) TaxID=1071378 RepID=J7SB03_NAUDC|nr:hypothetical protein NDAI_0G04580 [Naumovozyma dairenensis CBS 421]CCK73443.1 hypothetical protein NDAI_0G04580 [Naumovozyma dairenensis CBS 421]
MVGSFRTKQFFHHRRETYQNPSTDIESKVNLNKDFDLAYNDLITKKNKENQYHHHHHIRRWKNNKVPFYDFDDSKLESMTSFGSSKTPAKENIMEGVGGDDGYYGYNDKRHKPLRFFKKQTGVKNKKNNSENTGSGVEEDEIKTLDYNDDWNSTLERKIYNLEKEVFSKNSFVSTGGDDDSSTISEEESCPSSPYVKSTRAKKEDKVISREKVLGELGMGDSPIGNININSNIVSGLSDTLTLVTSAQSTTPDEERIFSEIYGNRNDSYL